MRCYMHRMLLRLVGSTTTEEGGPMTKRKDVPIRRLVLELPEDLIRSLKARASLEGVAPRDVVAAWIRSWAKPDASRPGGRR